MKVKKKVKYLGKTSKINGSPDNFKLDSVKNPHSDKNYAIRFVSPEFTSICPITSQPDFAKIIVDYVLVDATNKCPEITNRQISNFSFTPKSSGYNFASDVLLDSLYEEAILNNVNNFMSFTNNELKSNKCLDEG